MLVLVLVLGLGEVGCVLFAVVELSCRSWVELGGAGNCCALDDTGEAGSKGGHRKLAGNW